MIKFVCLAVYYHPFLLHCTYCLYTLGTVQGFIFIYNTFVSSQVTIKKKRKKTVAITENSYCNWSFCCWLGKMLYFLPFMSITHSFLTMWTWCRGSLVPTTLRQMEEDREFIMAANQLKQFGQVYALPEKMLWNFFYHAWIQPAQAVRSDTQCQNKISKIVLILAANQSVRSGTIIIIIYLQQCIQYIQSPILLYNIGCSKHTRIGIFLKATGHNSR